MRFYLLALCLVLCTCVRAQNAIEEITRFSVDVQARQNGTLDVTETITVVAAGDQIKRGITRALNLDPLGGDDLPAAFTYDVTSVTRDGVKEPFRVRKKGGMPTIYIGDKDVRLQTGTYTYVVKYRAANQVYPVGSTDEIRWPLEGKTGSLPVRDADITVRFDRDIDIIQSSCYTGNFGSTAENCEFSQDGNVVTFVATKGLQPSEGMTVSASIAQGYFTRPVPPPPPTPFERNAALYTLVIGLALAIGYAWSMWQKYGVDPEGPAVKHEYYPPGDLSPAALGYLHTGYPSHETVTASLTALNVDGYVTITEEKRKGFLTETEIFIVGLTDKIPPARGLPAEQRVVYDGIVIAGGFELNGDHNKDIEAITTEHQKALEEEHKPFIKDGLSYKGLLPLAGILLATLGLGLYFAVTTGIGAVPMAISGFLALFLYGFYAYLIQQPSLAKVTLLAEIKGFKKYLALSEKKRKALPNAPDMTQDYFQAVLPYAIALGIENNWAADLAADWIATGQRNTATSAAAAPFLLAGFGSRLGRTYSQTSVNPATGGGGGGGFAGGGGSVGGGGGTGGW